jgi:hypothetical protein
MDPDSRSRLLAPLHAAALELEEQGFDAVQIAVVLDMDPSAVGPLLRVAHAKLAQFEMLQNGDARPGPSRADPP